MSDQSMNTQAQPNAAPASTGPSIEELQAKLAETERAKEGLIREAQEQRAKRHELEQRLAQPASPPAQESGADGELRNVLSPVLNPIEKKVDRAYAYIETMEKERTLNYLASQMGRKPEEILADTAFQDKLAATANKWGLQGDMYSVAQKALELTRLEDLQKVEQERNRASVVASQQTLSGGIAPTPAASAKVYSADNFNSMSPREFDQMSRSGDFRKNPDGTFSYTPR